MKNINKLRNIELGLNNNEQIILNSLEHIPKRLKDIEITSKLPHSTVFDILRKLEKRRLVEYLYIDKKKLWRTPIQKTKKGARDYKFSDIIIYTKKKEILENMYMLFEESKNKRILVYHGSKSFYEWDKLANDKEITKTNLLIQDFNITIERFVYKKSFYDYMKKVSYKYKNSMINRSQITHILPEEVYYSKSEIFLFESEVVICESDLPRITILKNMEIVNMYKNIFNIFIRAGTRINSQEEFKKFL